MTTEKELKENEEKVTYFWFALSMLNLWDSIAFLFLMSYFLKENIHLMTWITLFVSVFFFFVWVKCIYELFYIDLKIKEKK